MDELEVIQSYGAMTAPEIAQILDKSDTAVARCIKFYMKTSDVCMIDVHFAIQHFGKKVFYIENALYKDLFQD